MSVIQPQFMPLWPIPFGYANIGQKYHNLNKQLVADIEAEKESYPSEKRTFAKNDSGWQSKRFLENKYKSFDELSKIIISAAIPLLHRSGVSPDVSFVANKLWANMIFAKGGWSNPHTHGSSDTFWSGVYYPKGMDDIKNLDEFDLNDYMLFGINSDVGGVLVVKDSNISKKMLKVKMNHEKYYGTNFSIIPRESLLILFPAWLEHYVTPTTDNSKRYSISFSISIVKPQMQNLIETNNVTIGRV